MSLYRSIYTRGKGNFEILLFSLLQKYKKICFVSLSLCLRDLEKSDKSYLQICFWLKKTKWSMDQSISKCLPHSKNKKCYSVVTFSWQCFLNWAHFEHFMSFTEEKSRISGSPEILESEAILDICFPFVIVSWS